MERYKARRQFIIPLLLKSARAKDPIKAVMLNISSKGMRIFSNDQRLLMMDEAMLLKRTFVCDFDFFNIPTKGLKVRIANVSAGKNKGFEKQLGLEFTNLEEKTARQIDRFVQEYSRR